MMFTQFAPGNPSEILVTSADSQIRVFNGITVLQKFKGTPVAAKQRPASPLPAAPSPLPQTPQRKGNPCFCLPGFKNTSSQLSASYSGDGRYVVCASEDSHVYVWRRAAGGMGSGAGGGIGVKAKTWLTSRSYEYFFCRDVSAAVPWPGSSPAPLPRAGDERASSSVHGGGGRRADDAFGDGVQLPPRPKSGPITFPGSQAEMLRRGPSSREAGCNAWGMVVVTASLGGEMRVYQNFGMPLGIKGQK